ncbi:hypothetical protein [Roseateles sp.]|uniref:hypothetical protein n=1 Tax=Roseateles sp. TaxID=1971397 RepID=UPI0032643705
MSIHYLHSFHPRRLALQALSCLLALGAPAAQAMDCPDPPKQQQRDWDTLVRTEVGRIGPVRGAELEAKVKNVTQDLLVKLPNADKLYLEQMMFSAYCSALRDDKSVSESVKARQILDYRRELQKALKP